MGWLVALALVVLLLCLPIGIRVAYGAAGLTVWLYVGPVVLALYPSSRRKGKPAQKQKAGKATSGQQQTGVKGGSFGDFLQVLKIVTNFLGGFRRKLRVQYLHLKLILGSDDPCDLAQNYGRGWAVLGNVMPHLERVFIIKKRNLEVECDFSAPNTTLLADMKITITVGRLLALVAIHGLRALKVFRMISNKRKGGANL